MPAQTSISDQPSKPDLPSKKEERNTFLFLAVVLAPVLSVCIVGGYGLMIWISQIFLGPPAG